MMPIILTAHAKINLHLAVGDRLPDGYHRVETVLQTLDWGDRLTFWPADDLTLSCNDKSLETEDNLVLRAAGRLRRETGCQGGAHMELEKHVPVGAGLGGGSADAAAALIGLSELWQLGLDADTLTEMATGLGADVPFFIHGGTRVATGIGDRTSPVTNRLDCQVVVAWPNRQLSAGEVYARFDALATPLSRQTQNNRGQLHSSAPLVEALAAGDLATVGARLSNDLETAIWRLCPESRLLKDRAQAMGAAALASGSGPAVYALVESPVEAQRLAVAVGSIAQVKIARFAPQGVSRGEAVTAGSYAGQGRHG